MIKGHDINPIRKLGVLETLFSAYSETGAMMFSLVAHFKGSISQMELAEAAERLQAHYALLAAAIGFDGDGGKAFFKSSVSITITTNKVEAANWEAEVAGELTTPFDVSAGPLMRLRLLTMPDNGYLIATFHHTIADGIGAIEIVRDLFAALTGLPVRGDGAAISMDTALSRDLLHFDHSMGASSPQPAEIQPISLHTVCFDEAETAALRHVAASRGASLHAALVVAFNQALMEIEGDKGVAARIMSPVNLHPLMPDFQSSGIFLTIGVSRFESSPQNFWSDAQRVKADLGPSRSLAAATGLINAVGNQMRSDPDYDAMRNRLLANVPYDHIATNLGVVKAFPDNDRFHVEQVFGPILRSVPGQFVIGASTYNDRLSLVETSVERTETLIDRIREILLDNSSREQD